MIAYKLKPVPDAFATVIFTLNDRNNCHPRDVTENVYRNIPLDLKGTRVHIDVIVIPSQEEIPMKREPSDLPTYLCFPGTGSGGGG